MNRDKKTPAATEMQKARLNHHLKSDSSGWKGTWNRPMKVDEKSLDPLTVARMTDHNVRGRDED